MRNESDEEHKVSKNGSKKPLPERKESSTRKTPGSMNLDHLRGPTEPLPNSKGNYNNSLEELKTLEDEETNRNVTGHQSPQVNIITESIAEEQPPNQLQNSDERPANFVKSPSDSMMELSD